MINWWARKELTDVCFLEQVKHVAQQARGERLADTNRYETGVGD